MSKKYVGLLGLMSCCVIAGIVLAEDYGNADSFDVEWDEHAVEGMTRAERLAYQQSYKTELKRIALERGWVPGHRQEFRAVDRPAQPPSRALGTINYASGRLGTCCRDDKMVGNQFDYALNHAGTAIGPVMMSGSITMATFEMMRVGMQEVFLSVYHRQVGTRARLVTSLRIPARTGVNVTTFEDTIVYSGSSFLAGIWQYRPRFDIPAVASGTVSGQRYHGMSINDIDGTGFFRPRTFNASIAVSGNVVTPVELLAFEIE